MLARLTGVLFVITFITSIPPVLWFYRAVLDDPNYVLSAGSDAGIAWGAFFELLLIAANLGTAVALFPILKRRSRVLALAFVASRLMESTFIAVGILCLLGVATLRQQATGLDPGAITAVAKALVILHNWTFTLGPGFVVGAGNGMVLGYLMYTTRLVPRGLALFGVVGGPLLLISGAAIVLGLIGPGSVPQGIATIPEFIWELGLGFWLIVKGVNPMALAVLPATRDS